MDNPNDIPPIKRKRGRPPKLSNPHPKPLEKWEPKDWKPHYDWIVSLSAIGYGNTTIAEKLKADFGFEYTPQHIGNIINCKQGKVVAQVITQRQRNNISGSIAERLQGIADKAVDNLERLITEEQFFEKTPIQVVDRGLALLKGLNHLKAENANSVGGINVQNAVIIPGEGATLIREAMQKSDEAKRLYDIATGDVKQLPSGETK